YVGRDPAHAGKDPAPGKDPAYVVKDPASAGGDPANGNDAASGKDPAYVDKDSGYGRRDPSSLRQRVRGAIFVALGTLVLAGPSMAPYDPGRQFDGYPYAPPMRPHVIDAAGAWHAPFGYPVTVVDRIERRYAEDRSRRVTFASAEPWFLLGSDGLGRD